MSAISTDCLRILTEAGSRAMGRLARLYLVAYNATQACGWWVVLIRLVRSIYVTKSIDGAYAAAGHLIRLLQLGAFLEVLHAAVGLVPSGVLPALMQWGGRMYFVAAIVSRIPEVQELPAVFVTFIAWSLSEVIRYPQYALNVLGICPGLLTWLRYSAFVVLYPIGAILGEMWLIYQALPYIKNRNIYSKLFNKLPFSHYSFVVVYMTCYPILWMKLYLYMLNQRRSKLGKIAKGKKQVRHKKRID